MERSAALADPPPAPPPAAVPGPRPRGLAARTDLRTRSATSDAVVFAAATYAAQALLFVAGVVQKGILGPEDTGWWALMGTLSTIFLLAPLGTFDGASRQIPVHRGAGDLARAARAADTAATFTLAAATLSGLIVIAVALLLGGSWPVELRAGLVLLGVLAPLRALSDCHELTIGAVKRFDAVSRSVVAKALVTVTLQTALVLLLGLWGMFAGLALATVAALAVWARMGLTGLRRPAFHLGMDRTLLRELIAFGVPLMLSAQVWLLFLTIDNVIVASWLSVTDLGYYALAVSVTTYILLLPRAIGAALFPRMVERFGATEDIRAIHRYATEVQRLLASALVPVLAAGAFFLVPVLIRHALPAFTPAIEVVRIMVAGAYCLALTSMPVKVLNTAGYRWQATALMTSCLAFNAGANVVAVGVLDAGIRGSAIATGVSYLVLLVSATTFALWRALPRRAVAAHLGELLAVVAAVLGTMWGIEALLGPGGGGLVGDAALALAKLALLVVALLPWLWLVERRQGGITLLRSVARSGLSRVRRGAG